jgi:hypothetical protein
MELDVDVEVEVVELLNAVIDLGNKAHIICSVYT